MNNSKYYEKFSAPSPSPNSSELCKGWNGIKDCFKKIPNIKSNDEWTKQLFNCSRKSAICDNKDNHDEKLLEKCKDWEGNKSLRKCTEGVLEGSNSNDDFEDKFLMCVEKYLGCPALKIPICPDGSEAKCCDVDDNCNDGDDDWCCGKDKEGNDKFFCSNDSREYAKLNGGKLCSDINENNNRKIEFKKKNELLLPYKNDLLKCDKELIDEKNKLKLLKKNYGIAAKKMFVKSKRYKFSTIILSMVLILFISIFLYGFLFKTKNQTNFF